MLKTPFFSKSSVVVSENPLATMIGVEVLRRGGNAVDAAVAISFALAVTVPHLGGIGGDFFALVRLPNSDVRFINGSGYAPRNATATKLKEMGLKEMPERGPLSPVVPGQVEGLHLLWKELGTFEWEELLMPAVLLASEGFPASHELVRTIAENSELLSRDEGSRFTYLHNGLPKPGDIVRFPNLARALRMIREDHRNFYEGDIAVKLSKYLQEKGGLLTYEDLKDFEAYEDSPLRMRWGDVEVYEMPPNTQGITTLQILKLLEGLNGEIPSRSSERASNYLEAYVKAYSLRDMYVTDPRFMSIKPSDLLTQGILSQAAGGLSRTSGGDGDTTFFAVIDGEGMAVAGIQSLFSHFGSGITEPTYGITLNARASSFTLIDGHANKLEPRKRPMHTLSAMIVNHGDDTFRVIGLSGGHYRPQLHALLFTNLYHYGMNPQEALDHPRFLWDPKTGGITVEEGFEPPMKARNVKKVPYPSRLGVAAIAEVVGGVVMSSYVDVRVDGLPAGLP
ncbi:MAG: gamma-glutamyltransferase family protein [Desulfurococcales archaeon]|nr:gamma-glutamyltransferase family protein [Desulfurococcales archaeon]